jgi:hypothetical protein
MLQKCIGIMSVQKRVIDLTRPPELNVPPGFDGKITTLNHNDVLCGKGSTISNHPGNIQLRTIAGGKKAEYRSSTIRMEKAYICAQLVADIRSLSPPGRFLKNDRKHNCWIEIGDEIARKKVAQVLRESSHRSEENNEPGHYKQPTNFQQPVLHPIISPLHSIISPTLFQNEAENFQPSKNAPCTDFSNDQAPFLASDTNKEMESFETAASRGLDHYARITCLQPAAGSLPLISGCKCTNENTVEAPVFGNYALEEYFFTRYSVKKCESEDCPKVSALELGLYPNGRASFDAPTIKEPSPPYGTNPYSYVDAPGSLTSTRSPKDTASFGLDPFDSKGRDYDTADRLPILLNSRPSHPKTTESTEVDYSITPFATVQYASRRSSIKSWASYTSERYFSDFSIAALSDILSGKENELSNGIELMTSLKENENRWFHSSYSTTELEENQTETEHIASFQSDLSESSIVSFAIDSFDDVSNAIEDSLSVVSYMTVESDMFLNNGWEEGSGRPRTWSDVANLNSSRETS